MSEFVLLSGRDPTRHVSGSESYMTAIATCARRLGLKPHVLAEDSGSMSVLEALQYRAAIVCSDVDGLPEDLTNGQDGLPVAPGDPHELADEIARLLADPRLRGRLSRGARATYEARFTPQRATADLARVYTSLGLNVRAGVQ